MLRPIIKPQATLLICLSLVTLTLAVYSQVFHFGFVMYDDPHYVVNNSHVHGLTFANIGWAFTTNTESNWHPLTWISHMIDWQIYGDRAGGHHATNLLFHIANTLLLFLLLNRVTGTLWRSAVVAALFASHPIHVESVAWVSERKDVLSTCFGLLAIWAYVCYTERRKFSRYVWVLVLFACSLMSKPTLVTLPLLLLLLDFWPLNRISTASDSWVELKDGSTQALVPRSVLLEKIPLLFLSGISSVLTLWAQQEAMIGQTRLPLMFRFCNAALSYCKYIRNTLWPTKLVIDYPYPKVFPVVEVVVIAGVLVYGTFWILRRAKEFKFLFTGWFWFLGALVPMIGIVQVGLQSMADRYTYIPSIGLFIIVVWGGYELASRRGLSGWPMFTAAASAIAICIPLSIAQIGCWRNSLALWEHAVRIRPDHFIAEYNLATLSAKQGNLAEAQAHLERSLQINPYSFMARDGLAEMLVYEGKFAEAIPHFYEAMRVYPAGATAEFHTHLAQALEHVGKTREAVAEYKLALDLDPRTGEALNSLAWILATDPDEQIRNGSEAVRLAEEACRLTGFGDAPSLATLAAAYGEAGRFDQAEATAKKAQTLASSAGNQKLSDQAQKMVDSFRAHQPFRETQKALEPQ
jgi:protein O-mannosyl-transferase